jgi:signal transduction histidine kinase/ligand-binding sensor domain-containing protein
MASKLLVAIHFLFCPAWIFYSAAQKNPHFIEKLTIGEGLSSNRINDMVQDDMGFLWIATSDGLNRFDGTEVVQYFYRDSLHTIPHNYVYCLKKLPGDQLAIGTQSGLCFYNGRTGTFRNFYHIQHNLFDEYNNTIVGLELDTRGNLWVSSRNCIYVFDSLLTLKRIYNTPFTEVDVSRRRLRYTSKIMALSAGRVLLCLYDGWYIGSASSGHLTRLEQSALADPLRFVREASTLFTGEKFEQYFPYGHVFKIFDGIFLCFRSDEDSLRLMNEKGQELSSCYFPFNRYPYVLWSQQVNTMDSSEIIFIFHNFGLCRLFMAWKNGQPTIRNLSPMQFESSEYIGALIDHQGNYWLATAEEGLQKVSPYKQIFSSGILEDRLTGSQVKYETNNIGLYGHAIWISTYGEGFFRVDPASGTSRQYLFRNTGDDLWANFIWNFSQPAQDTLWIGTQKGLFWFRVSSGKYGRIGAIPGKPPELDSLPISLQFLDSHGLIWLGLGRGRGTCYYDVRARRFTYYPGNSKEYPFRYPLTVSENNSGDLWFTNDASNLLAKWERSTGLFHTFSLPSANRNRMSNLYGIFCEKDSICWLGSIANGLIKFNVQKNSLSIYGHDRGLINSHIRSICQDREKRLWLVTDGGLSCFDPRTEIFFNYTIKDGLPVNFPSASFFYDSLNFRLYSGGKGSYFYFDPDRISTSLPPQETRITDLLVDGVPYGFDPGKPFRFSAQQNDITISYTAVDLSEGPQTRYQYKLVGEDTGWIMAQHQRQINLSHLAPGKYQFIVRSLNNQGIGSPKEASIRFTISPPFTQTSWFYGIMLVAMGGLFYASYRFRLRQLKRTEQIRNEISKNLHDEVGSTLTNISLGSLLAQKQLQQDGFVRPLLERIYQDSQTVSQTMREIIWSINPKIDTLGEALPRMLQYASELLEAKNIELQADITPQIEQLKLTMERRRDLYLIFKESVNNLARHSDAQHARISFQLLGPVLVMTIADDGAGFIQNLDSTGNGLKNMKERAARHRWELDLNSRPGAGTTLVVRAIIA